MTAPASPADRARALLRQWAEVHQAATEGEWTAATAPAAQRHRGGLVSEPIRVGEQPPRAPRCPADRTTMGRPCEGPGSYYCDDSCDRVALRAGPPHVVDNLGRVWLLIKGGGMGARVVTEGWDEKVQTAGIAWLAREHGPLLPFDSLQFRRDFPRSEAGS